MLPTAVFAVFAACPPTVSTLTVQVVGLFEPSREQDLKDLIAAKLPHLTVVAVDFATAELTVRFNAATTWTANKADDRPTLLSNELGGPSRGTFGVKAKIATPPGTLTTVEIPVAGCKCKGCSLAAYRMVYQLPGVEYATASFAAGKVTARIDPTKTSKEKLEEALKKGGVEFPK